MVDGRGPAGIGRVAIKGISCKRLRTHCMNHPHQYEAIENGRFTMIQVWQAEHSATIVRLDSRFAHDDGLQCRSIELRQTVWKMQET